MRISDWSSDVCSSDLLYLGGLDTVTSLLGNIFNFLASHPEHQNALRNDPSQIVLAVEEFLRAFAPVTAFRIATKEIDIRGQKIMPGDYVAVSTSVVGRDPTRSEEHTSELQSLMRTSYAVFCLTKKK